jgi:ribulose-5-phosphate 4-epimerase/fuculose-1-phosphate aldolase
VTIDEGYTKFSVDWHRCDLPALVEIDDLCRWRKPLFDAGLIGIYEDLGIGFGNISVRIGASAEFLISGTQTGHLTDVGAQHFARVVHTDPRRNHVTCSGPVQASSESMTHAELYRIDPRINAVVHVHSERLWNALLDVLPTTSRDTAYGTPAMAAEFSRIHRDPAFKSSGVAVMGGHEAGLIGVGRSLEEAANRILGLQIK